MINPGTPADDRRRVCRYSALLQHAFLGWWHDEQFKQVPGLLVDLSLNGCFLELARLPDLAVRQAVWVHLHKTSQLEWIEGRLISIKKPLLRKCQVRVLFVAPLGYEPFKKLVYGPEHLSGSTDPLTPEHERDHFWK